MDEFLRSSNYLSNNYPDDPGRFACTWINFDKENACFRYSITHPQTEASRIVVSQVANKKCPLKNASAFGKSFEIRVTRKLSQQNTRNTIDMFLQL